MDYFKNLLQLLKTERDDDREAYLKLTQSTSVTDRRAAGITWYPIAIRGSEPSRGDYLTVEVGALRIKTLPISSVSVPRRCYSLTTMPVPTV